ncbi:MAG TPA: hypothetical protein VMH81_19345 [Bryobacteraceae bacterium]|nr:hypothetical protein [Bryobacteraceae bacterium]
MQSTLGKMIQMGGLLFGGAAVVMTMASPAAACSRPGSGGAAAGAALSSRVLSLRNLGFQAPPKIGARETPGAAKDNQPQADPLNPSIVGLWQVMDTDDKGQPIDLSFELWHSDGTEVLVDQSAPATGNVCIGTWLQTGTLTYKLTHPALNFDMNGNFLGTVLINEVVTLDRSGFKFSGTYTVDIFDITGELLDHLDGKFIGSKVNPPA